MHTCNTHANCMKSFLDKVETVCSERNIKLTKLRKDILKLVLEGHTPVGAYEILAKLKLENKSAKPITVYRILDLFLENNIVHKIKSLNKFLSCSHPGETHDCCFLICNKCDNVEETCNKELLQNIHLESKKNKFTAKNIMLEINGICQNCS